MHSGGQRERGVPVALRFLFFIYFSAPKSLNLIPEHAFSVFPSLPHDLRVFLFPARLVRFKQRVAHRSLVLAVRGRACGGRERLLVSFYFVRDRWCRTLHSSGVGSVSCWGIDSVI